MNVTKDMIDAWVKDAPEWAVGIVKRESKHEHNNCAYAYVGEKFGYQYILFSNDVYLDYVGKKFAFQEFQTDGDSFKYEVLAKTHQEPVVGEDVLVHFDGDNSSVWTKFKLEYQKGDVVVLYDYRIEDVETYRFSRITMKKYVKTVRENAIDQIASLIGRGTFAEDAEAIYDAIKSNEISIFTEEK
ncbi:hypothetical protein [Klebsiella phage 05F01]|nr:hypothetical protein [Klebsiella phage 05F01]